MKFFATASAFAALMGSSVAISTEQAGQVRGLLEQRLRAMSNTEVASIASIVSGKGGVLGTVLGTTSCDADEGGTYTGKGAITSGNCTKHEQGRCTTGGNGEGVSQHFSRRVVTNIYARYL